MAEHNHTEVAAWLVPAVAQVLLFVLLACMAASVDTEVLREKFRSSLGILVGLGLQFVALPAVGFAAVRVFDLDPIHGITLLAVTSSPGGAYSNWWCSLFNADLALSVAMTTCSTIVSMVFTPLNMSLYTKMAYMTVPNMNLINLLSSICTAVVAMSTGLLVSYLKPGWRQRCNICGNVAGICMILFSVLFASKSHDPIWSLGGSFYAAVAAPCLIAMLISFGMGMTMPCLTGPEVVACTVETCYQNTGLALTIALATFDEEDRGKAAVVPLFYGLVQVVCLPVFLLLAWKAGLTYAPASAWIHDVVFGNFQPTDMPYGSELARVVTPRSPQNGDDYDEVVSWAESGGVGCDHGVGHQYLAKQLM